MELILLLVEISILKFAIVSNNEYVGVIIEFNDIPSTPINLVVMILMSKPIILVIQPPIKRISVDFRNLFFVGFSPL